MAIGLAHAVVVSPTGLGVAPPLGLSPVRGAAWGFTFFSVAMFVAVGIWGAWMLIRRRDAVPLALLLGGAMCGLVEPIGDIIGLTWYPRSDPLIVYTAWGRSIPSWVPLGEGMFFALAGYGAYRLMLAGRPVKTLLLWWLCFSVFDSAMEMFATHEHAWVYYGHNPSRILGLPLYAIVQNGGVAIVTGWVALVAAPHLRGRRWAAMLLIVPCAFLGQAVVCTWPVYTALNSDASSVVFWPIAVLATAINFALPFGLLRTPAVARLRRGGGAQPSPTPVGAEASLVAPAH